MNLIINQYKVSRNPERQRQQLLCKPRPQALDRIRLLPRKLATPKVTIGCGLPIDQRPMGSASHYICGDNLWRTTASPQSPLYQQPTQFLIIRESLINTQQLRLMFNGRGDDDAINRILVMFGQ